MRISSLKSTTCLVLSFTLVTSPTFAQDADAPTDDLSLCAGLDGSAEAQGAVEVDLAAEPTFPCLGVDGDVIADAAELMAVIDVETQAQSDVEMDSETITTTEVIATGKEAIAEAEAETAQADVEEPAEANSSVVVATTAEQDVSGDGGSLPDASADVVVEAEVGTDTAPETEMADTDSMSSDAQADAPVTTTTAETGTGTEALPDADGMPEGDDAAQIADLPTIGEENGADADAEIVFEDVQTEEPAAAAAADADVTATATIEVEELTQEDVRSSAQDFDTAAISDISDRGDSDDEGLSNFQKALLLGLGAVAVGSILDNGDEVVSNSGDRVVVERNGQLVVLKDDDVLLRQAGSQVRTESFQDGSTRAVVTRPDGSQIVTIRANDGRVLRRERILEDGTRIVLFDDTEQVAPVIVTELAPAPLVAQRTSMSDNDMEALRRALMASQDAPSIRTFSLQQVRAIREVRELAPEVELDTITFATASAAIQPGQADELANLSLAILDILEEDPSQIFLIEGHTDAVGDASYNLALSDRRAETVALAMTEFFGVPPENLITQGYGETMLKVQTLEAERLNRRAAVRNITSLLR